MSNLSRRKFLVSFSAISFWFHMDCLVFRCGFAALFAMEVANTKSAGFFVGMCIYDVYKLFPTNCYDKNRSRTRPETMSIDLLLLNHVILLSSSTSQWTKMTTLVWSWKLGRASVASDLTWQSMNIGPDGSVLFVHWRFRKCWHFLVLSVSWWSTIDLSNPRLSVLMVL